MNPLSHFIVAHHGPMSVVRACRCCKWYTARRLFSGVGRGNGFREGNKQIGLAIAHVKQCAHVREALLKAGV